MASASYTVSSTTSSLVPPTRPSRSSLALASSAPLLCSWAVLLRYLIAVEHVQLFPYRLSPLFLLQAELFEPKYGLIVKDKDELTLPLMLETIPTPKEFKDAIESLSPEQQRYIL